MDRLLTGFIWLWAGLQIAANLASMFFVSDEIHPHPWEFLLGEGMVLLHRKWLLVHTGYLFGNLIFALPAVGAVWLRQRFRDNRRHTP